MKYNKIIKKSLGNRFVLILKVIYAFFQSVILYLKLYKNNYKRANKSIVSKGTVILPLIETAHYMNIQLLLVAKGLQKRGFEIVVVVCDAGLIACETRSAKIKESSLACLQCKFNIKIVESFDFKIEYLSADKFTNFDYLDTDELNEDFEHAIKDSVDRHFYGDLPTNKEQVSVIQKRYLETLSKSNHVSQLIIKEYRPKILLAYMMVYAENVPWVRNAMENGLRVVHVCNTQFNEHALTLNFWDLYSTSDRYNGFLDKKGLFNSENEDFELDKYIERRFSGKLLSRNLDLSQEVLGSQQTLDRLPFLEGKDRKNIFLFPNILWDSGMSTQNSIFKSIEDWLLKTVSYLADKHEFNVIVKCHPQERTFTNKSKTAYDAIQSYFKGRLPKNLHVIDYNSNISSYDLFPFMDACCVYNGTIGLEAMLSGKQVLTGGRSPYHHLTLTATVKNVEDYYGVFREIANGTGIKPNMEAVRRFAYFYFIKAPIPWNLTSKAVGASYYKSLKHHDLDYLVSVNDKYFEHLLDSIEHQHILPENW